MKKVLFSILMLGAITGVTAQKIKSTLKPKPVAGAPMKNLLDSFSYAAGYNVALNMKDQGITTINAGLVQKAMNDVFQNKTPQLNSDQLNSSLQKQLAIFNEKKAAAAKAPGIAFLEKNKLRPGIITLPSGLQYEILKAGDSNGIKPKRIDTVTVNYIGSLIDGTEFNNSYKAGQPAVFPLSGVIRGWTDALELMTVGAKWKIYVPTELAYDMSPRDPRVIPPGAALVFEIELEGIKHPEEATKPTPPTQPAKPAGQ